MGRAGASHAARRPPPPLPPLRTKWTRRVRHPVLIGHAASFKVLESFGVVRPLEDIPAAEQAAAEAACAAAQARLQGLWGGAEGGASASAEGWGGADGARSGAGGSSDSLSSGWELFWDSHERASARRFPPPGPPPPPFPVLTGQVSSLPSY